MLELKEFVNRCTDLIEHFTELKESMGNIQIQPYSGETIKVYVVTSAEMVIAQCRHLKDNLGYEMQDHHMTKNIGKTLIRLYFQ